MSRHGQPVCRALGRRCLRSALSQSDNLSIGCEVPHRGAVKIDEPGCRLEPSDLVVGEHLLDVCCRQVPDLWVSNCQFSR